MVYGSVMEKSDDGCDAGCNGIIGRWTATFSEVGSFRDPRGQRENIGRRATVSDWTGGEQWRSAL